MSNIQQELIKADAKLRDIRTIKTEINELELALAPFMEADLSDATLRNEMRQVLSQIDTLQVALTAKLGE